MVIRVFHCRLYLMGFENGESFRLREGEKFITRVVVRRVEERNEFECNKCEKQITFNAKHRPKQIIANVYDDDGMWQGTYIYHEVCYEQIGQPHGQAVTGMAQMTQSDYS